MPDPRIVIVILVRVPKGLCQRLFVLRIIANVFGSNCAFKNATVARPRLAVGRERLGATLLMGDAEWGSSLLLSNCPFPVVYIAVREHQPSNRNRETVPSNGRSQSGIASHDRCPRAPWRAPRKSIRRDVIGVLRSLANGISHHVSLITVEAGLRQSAGDGKRIEHQVFLSGSKKLLRAGR